MEHFSTNLQEQGDVQSCTNYRGIKLMSHTMKLWEMIIGHLLSGVTNITVNQFGFMPGRSIKEVIFLIWWRNTMNKRKTCIWSSLI
jgi:hypothetical protein